MATTNTGAAKTPTKATRKATDSARKTSGSGSAAAKRATSRSSTTPRKTGAASRRTTTTGARATDAGRTGRSAATRPAAWRGVDDVLRPVASAARQTVGVVSVPVGQARRVLDRKGGLPVYLGAGALAVVGALEWPVAAGVGLGYAGLRRWGPRLPEPVRSLTGSRPDR